MTDYRDKSTGPLEPGSCFEFPWPDKGEKGDFVRVDSKGYWSLKRYSRATPAPKTLQLGRAARRKLSR